ncbi:ABC transporter ATP-binding protein/permease [Streptomyces sp. bgisy100]|uniref:ABC transporter ATP-binding protein/permease n=1 Tax=Streptomyces sp. bgisy100 TaxID=3413783 RepID=UPI003D757C16
MMNKPGGPAIRARGLSVVRGGRTVLDTLDFDIPRGGVTGLLGPSGCGKSTLMRAVAGTQAKVTGTLDVLGHPAGAAPLRSRVGYVTQAPSVYADLTARQNLDYYAAVLDPRQGRTERRAEVDRALAEVDLGDHADALAGTLSGGQRSRVSLAVALLGRPELLVLDEPTVGLGLFVSAFAASEFQAVQFMPAVIFPQLLLCGLFAPRDTMQPVLEAVSDVLPMSYAVDGMNEVLRHSSVTGDFVRDAAVVAGSALLVLALGAATLRRRTV